MIGSGQIHYGNNWCLVCKSRQTLLLKILVSLPPHGWGQLIKLLGWTRLLLSHSEWSFVTLKQSLWSKSSFQIWIESTWGIAFRFFFPECDHFHRWLAMKINEPTRPYRKCRLEGQELQSESRTPLPAIQPKYCNGHAMACLAVTKLSCSHDLYGGLKQNYHLNITRKDHRGKLPSILKPNNLTDTKMYESLHSKREWEGWRNGRSMWTTTQSPGPAWYQTRPPCLGKGS